MWIKETPKGARGRTIKAEKDMGKEGKEGKEGKKGKGGKEGTAEKKWKT